MLLFYPRMARANVEAFESYLGKFKAGDMVLDVRKLEPVSLGSSHYIYTDKGSSPSLLKIFASETCKII